MKKQIEYKILDEKIIKEITYIPIRYIVAMLISLLETVTVIGIVIGLCYFEWWFYVLALLTHGACILKLVASDDNPDYKVPWLLVLMLLPIVGFMLYFMFYSRKLKKKFIKRLEDVAQRYEYDYDDTEAVNALEKEDVRALAQARTITSTAWSKIFMGTEQRYFPSGEELWQSMLTDLEAAEHSIFVYYFIIEEGVFWNSMLDILKRKASEGVTVKVLYDDIGCMSTLPGRYDKQLSKYGIEARIFSKLRGNADSEFNNRSHRKILVIDGKVGYTGGVNIADEYINKKARFGHWKDTAIRLEGHAVYELSHMFISDFAINGRRMPDVRENLYPSMDKGKAKGYVIPFGDGPRPIYKRNVGKTVIQNMLYSAERYVYMTTPYLIIDNDLCNDIENTALRGVDVRIIVPHIPDKRIVFTITKSYYARLIDAGVRIYEYEPGFIHAKNYVSDDKYAIIGTINLDYRSLVHHFENGVWMYNTDTVKDIKQDIDDTLSRSIEITGDMLKVGFFTRLIRAIVKVFSPML